MRKIFNEFGDSETWKSVAAFCKDRNLSEGDRVSLYENKGWQDMHGVAWRVDHIPSRPPYIANADTRFLYNMVEQSYIKEVHEFGKEPEYALMCRNMLVSYQKSIIFLDTHTMTNLIDVFRGKKKKVAINPNWIATYTHMNNGRRGLSKVTSSELIASDYKKLIIEAKL